jgi:hypothetical protein
MHCGSSALRRINRHGFLEETMLPKLGLYPWECAMCRKKTFLRDNGHAEIRRKQGSRAGRAAQAPPDAPVDDPSAGD